MLLYVEKEMDRKVLRGFSGNNFGMYHADQYDVNKRLCRKRRTRNKTIIPLNAP